MQRCFLIINLLTLLGATTNLLAQHSSKKYRAEGMIYQTTSYCGGAMPSEEILEHLQKPQPFAGKTIYFRSGKNNTLKKISASAITDSAGRFSVMLKPGTYCIIDSTKFNPLKIPANDAQHIFDTLCLRKSWKNCDYSFKIKTADIKNIAVTYNNYCFFNRPCVIFKGSLPPAPAPSMKD
jgi:hypothetical protein